MQVSRFYSLQDLMVDEWFDMLDNQAQPDLEIDEQETTYIYKVESDASFYLNNKTQEPGIYLMKASPAIAEDISKNYSLNVHKFSFSQLVFLSDLFSTSVPILIPDEEEILAIADKGEAANYLKEFPSTEGLVKMREKVWNKYFDQGLMAMIRRFFSSLSQFFIKYNKFVETGVWPGNTCTYADQVVAQINLIKRIFIAYAYKASKLILSERLGKTLEELEEMEFEAIQKLYRQKALRTHPDKNRASNAAAQFEEINSIWEDFAKLNRLKLEFKVDQLQEEDEKSLLIFEKELAKSDKILSTEDPTSLDKILGEYRFKTGHPFKSLLTLPASVN